MRVQPNEDLVCLADSTVNADEPSSSSYAPSYSCDQITDSSIECQATSCKYNRCNCKDGFTQNGLNCEIGWFWGLKNNGLLIINSASEPIETVSIDLISSQGSLDFYTLWIHGNFRRSPIQCPISNRISIQLYRYFESNGRYKKRFCLLAGIDFIEWHCKCKCKEYQSRACRSRTKWDGNFLSELKSGDGVHPIRMLNS